MPPKVSHCWIRTVRKLLVILTIAIRIAAVIPVNEYLILQSSLSGGGDFVWFLLQNAFVHASLAEKQWRSAFRFVSQYAIIFHGFRTVRTILAALRF